MRVKYLSSTKGFGIIELLVVVVVLAIIGAGGYLYFQQTQSEDADSSLTTQEKAELKAACKLEIDDDLLCSVFTNWGAMSNEPVTHTTTMVDAAGNKNTMVVKSDGDDYHSTMEFDGQAMESIQLANVQYTKMDGVWYKHEMSEKTEVPTELEEEDPSDQLDEVFSEEKADKVTYKRLGNEACGDTTCVKYELTYSDDSSATNYFWIEPKSQRIMRAQLKEEDGSSFDMVYKYGAVTITAPVDAKDYSEMFSM